MGINTEVLIKEFDFKTSRSGGKGGQHVNKVSSRVELLWSVEESTAFTTEEKELIKKKLANRINKGGVLQLSSDEDRSQLRNKNYVVERALNLLQNSIKTNKARKATKPNHTAVEKRIEQKKKQALKKINRSNNWL